MLNNRELAILVWLGLFFAWAFSKRDVRSSFGGLLRTASSPTILMPFGAMLGYVALEVWLGSKASLWRADLTKDTVSWFIVSGTVLFFKFDQASKPHFFRRRIVAVLGITAFLGFFANFFVLSLVAELFLQPFVVILAMLAVIAERQEATRSVKKLADGVLVLIGLALLAFVSQQLYANWGNINTHTALLQLLLPIWLTIGLLPFIYLLSLYANYDSAFRRINFFVPDDRKARRRAKLALVTHIHFRSRDSHDFAGRWFQQLASAPNLGAARQVVTEFQQSRRGAERAAREEQERLRRYAGSDATDAEGRRLDRREFKETTKALRWLATCMEGWYHNEDHGGQRYRADLLTALGNDFFKSYGLPPEDPGVTMEVSKDGQSFYAWRRTVTGWCFAIGAAGPPPDQWEHDGPELPHGFPGKDRRWGKRPFSDEVNRNWTS